MPPLPSTASIWYWPSSAVPTNEDGSSSRTSPSVVQKLRLSSNFSLQAGQYFMRELVYNEGVWGGEEVVVGYIVKSSAKRLSNKAQGCRAAATLGKTPKFISPTPTGLRTAQPFQ